MLRVDTAELAAAAGRLEATGDRLTATGPLLTDANAAVARLAAPRTPRRTGRLAASVSVSEAGVRWGVGYAVYVNFGTRFMAARPFATAALTAAETTVETLARQWATNALEET